MGSGYRPPEGARFYRADFPERKIMGKPLAPRQGAALSAFAVAFGFRQCREGVAGGNVPQRWVAEDAQRLKTGRSGASP